MTMERAVKAFNATRALKLPDEKVKPVLTHLLKLLENKWEPIEAENYRALIDAYFELKEDKGEDDRGNPVVEPGESRRLHKRLCSQGPGDQASSASSTKDSANQVLSPGEDQKPVVKLEKGVTLLNKKDSNSSGCSSSSKKPQQKTITGKMKRPAHIISKNITKGTENVEISLVDQTGKQKQPRFTYMRDNVIYQDAYVHISLARVADEHCCTSCSGDCLLGQIPCECARETGGEFAYTTGGQLSENFLTECMSMKQKPQKHNFVYCLRQDCPLERSKNEHEPEKCKGHLIRKFIKECWRKCGCTMQCGNRVVQRGITCKLQVFWTGEGKGWGLKTLQDVPKGTFVCEYVGEILTNTELWARNKEGSANEKHTYPVTLDADWGSERTLKDEEALCLDATFRGNVARFINHRCYNANLIDIPVEIETPDRHYYHLALFTSRDVKASEELTWDYGIDFNDHEHPIKAFRCCCGSKFCRDVKRSS